MRTLVSIAAVVLVSLVLGGIPLLCGRSQLPNTHDEFAYLLAADTFLHGRLTNPPHPLWRYFETFHELMTPTYSSKYPPAQGATLAIGRLLGHPSVGAFGTIALACGAIVWMLRAWMPLRRAVLGGLLAATHPLVYWWGQIYWGGGVAMLAGALLGGAAFRAARTPKPRWGVVFGAALGLMANSRPFEGFLLTAIIVSWMVWRWVRRNLLRMALTKFFPAAAAVMVPVLAWMGYYNYRITGHALTFPYSYFTRQYQRAPLVFGMSPKPAHPDMDPKLAQFWDDFDWHEYEMQTTPAGYLRFLATKLYKVADAWIDQRTLALALLPIPWLARRRRVGRWALLLAVALPAIQLLCTPWLRMPYLAPGVPFFFGLLAPGLCVWWRWRPARMWLGPTIVVLVLGFQAIACARQIVSICHNDHPQGFAREQIQSRLEQLGGKHLIVVRYTPRRQLLFEWVFNDADIDASQIIWARDRGPQTIPDLRQYYRHDARRFWLLEVDGAATRLSPIPTPAPSSIPSPDGLR